MHALFNQCEKYIFKKTSNTINDIYSDGCVCAGVNKIHIVVRRRCTYSARHQRFNNNNVYSHIFKRNCKTRLLATLTVIGCVCVCVNKILIVVWEAVDV